MLIVIPRAPTKNQFKNIQKNIEEMTRELKRHSRKYLFNPKEGCNEKKTNKNENTYRKLKTEDNLSLIEVFNHSI